MIPNTIYSGDVFDFLKNIETKSIDLAIIDPPYNLNKAKWDSFQSQNDFMAFTKNYLDKTIATLKDTASLYIFNTAYNSIFIAQHLIENGLYLQNWITWYKKDGFSACKKKYCNNQEKKWCI